MMLCVTDYSLLVCKIVSPNPWGDLLRTTSGVQISNNPGDFRAKLASTRHR